MANAIAMPFDLPPELSKMIILYCFDVSPRRGVDRPKYMRTNPSLKPVGSYNERHMHALRCRAICKAFFVAGSLLWLGPQIPGSGLFHLRTTVGMTKYIHGVATVLIDAVKSDLGRLTTATYAELYHHGLTIGCSTPPGAKREFECWQVFASDVPVMILRARLTEAQQQELLKLFAHIFRPFASSGNVSRGSRMVWVGGLWTPTKGPTVADVLRFQLKALQPMAEALLAIEG